jgi:Transposase, Mutator family
MATIPALTDRTEAERWREVRDEDALWGDLRPELLAAVRPILEATMEDELTALILAGRYERTRERIDHRNGIYRRLLVTELGATELDVPRRRLVPYRPSFLERAARRTASVDGLLREAFLRGSRPARPPGSPSGSPASRSARARSAGSAGRSTPGSPRSTRGRSRSRPATCSATASGSRCATGAAGRRSG